MQHYSPEDLIRYLYKETSPAETISIEQALEKDWTLREKLEVLQASQHRLNTLVEKPRTETLLSIFRYAAATEAAKA